MKRALVSVCLLVSTLAAPGPAVAIDSFFDILTEVSSAGPPYPPQLPQLPIQGVQVYPDGPAYLVSSFFDIFMEVCSNGVGGPLLPSEISAFDSGGGPALYGIDSFFDVFLDTTTYVGPSSFFDVYLEVWNAPGPQPVVTGLSFARVDSFFDVFLEITFAGGTTANHLQWATGGAQWKFATSSTASILPGGSGISMQMALESTVPQPDSGVILMGAMNGTTTLVPEPCAPAMLAVGALALLARRRRG